MLIGIKLKYLQLYTMVIGIKISKIIATYSSNGLASFTNKNYVT